MLAVYGPQRRDHDLAVPRSPEYGTTPLVRHHSRDHRRMVRPLPLGLGSAAAPNLAWD
jgi:hypothetical protein